MMVFVHQVVDDSVSDRRATCNDSEARLPIDGGAHRQPVACGNLREGSLTATEPLLLDQMRDVVRTLGFGTIGSLGRFVEDASAGRAG
ncbi:hypothetical protein [Cellulomonas fimi]|uniref:Uncharacterized protein n=1 Tax=Cellulomonas fimi TaxID=1708 RepID=A0A7Y0QIL6_CELFI|nr:hypothetical protein [Cellulomonas fimi]NMR21348.1 hypothetical protein [Cellulomonas fimi]